MTQPDQCLGVELARALAGETQRRADLVVEERRMTPQSIARNDDVFQSRGQATYHSMERLPNCFRFPDDRGIPRFELPERSLIPMESSIRLDGTPDMVFNASPGVGGKGEAPPWVETQDRSPKTDATGLQGFLKWQFTQHLLAHHSLDKAVVVRHQLVEAFDTASLCLDELSGLWGSGPGATLSRVYADLWGKNWTGGQLAIEYVAD